MRISNLILAGNLNSGLSYLITAVKVFSVDNYKPYGNLLFQKIALLKNYKATFTMLTSDLRNELALL